MVWRRWLGMSGAQIPRAWLIHTINVQPYLGQTGDGTPSYGTAFDLPCLVEERRRHIRGTNSPNSTGDELWSSATAYADLGYAGTVTNASLVTLPSGRTTRVLDVGRRDGGNLPVPSHLELILE